MHALAPAKINLHLRVAPPRADGFHPLSTWMTTIGLFDKLTFEPAPAGHISMTCTDHSIPVDGRNLVVKAARILQADGDRSVTIHLDKKIPHGGGLGGGSSDAATTLVALNEVWNLNHTVEHLSQLAAQLGSDIPFFLHGPGSICSGRGEIIRPIQPPTIAKWVLLILPDLSMPTPAVYRKFDELAMGDASIVDDEPDWEKWRTLPSRELLPLLINDLEPPAFAIVPQLDALRSKIESDLQRPIRMSGSGSSLFTLYDSQLQATAAAEHTATRHRVSAQPIELAPRSDQI